MLTESRTVRRFWVLIYYTAATPDCFESDWNR